MKTAVNISRILVGALFIFSGLVKAIDPNGLAYKMQEFFEVWGGIFAKLHNYTLPFAIAMITAEVVLGVALLLGVFKKITIWLLLLLTVFFTFLTSYVLFSGKIRACGCFGDCIPLTPVQTFTKDIILLALCLLLLVGRKYIQPINNKAWLIVLVAFTGVSYLQYYVLKHLPLVDCLPYKKGNNLIEQRKVPKDATFDKYEYSFFYKKDGVAKEFTLANTPDSTWAFSKQGSKKLVSKGNGKTAAIGDFILNTASGTDTTEAILNQTGEYFILFIRDLPQKDNPYWRKDFTALKNKTKLPCFYVTSQPAELNKRIDSIYTWIPIPILTLDGTALKTASRADMTLFKMNGPVVQEKMAAADMQKLLK